MFFQIYLVENYSSEIFGAASSFSSKNLVSTLSSSFFWNNLWDHSMISSGRFVAGVNATK